MERSKRSSHQDDHIKMRMIKQGMRDVLHKLAPLCVPSKIYQQVILTQYQNSQNAQLNTDRRTEHFPQRYTDGQ